MSNFSVNATIEPFPSAVVDLTTDLPPLVPVPVPVTRQSATLEPKIECCLAPANQDDAIVQAALISCAIGAVAGGIIVYLIFRS